MGSTTAKALRYGPCVTRGSHSFTCHPHTNHTCLYSPAARHHRPFAGTHCDYPRRDGQAELTWVAGHIGYRDKCPASGIEPDTVTHLSTNHYYTIQGTTRRDIEYRVVMLRYHFFDSDKYQYDIDEIYRYRYRYLIRK